MKKLFTLLSPIVLIFLLGSCAEDEYIIVSPHDILVPATGGRFYYSIDTNGNGYSIDCSEDWVDTYQTETIIVEANNTNNSRYAYIYFYSEYMSTCDCLIINQEAASNGGSSSTLPAPYNLTATANGRNISLNWEYSGPSCWFNVYYSTSSSGPYKHLGHSVEDTSDWFQVQEYGTYYCKVTAYSYSTKVESAPSNIASITISKDGSSGGNTGNDSGGSTTTTPSAPTNVVAQNYGNNYLPEVHISWNSVSNATSYAVYRSSSSSSGYSKLGTTYNTYYSDFSPNSGKNYYKVKAINSAGESGYSNYTMFNWDTSSSLVPAPPTVSVSGSSYITVSWTCPTGSGFGKATSYDVYKRDPETAKFNLVKSTSSTSYSDSNTHPGINRYAVVAKNAAGSSVEGFGYSSEIPLSRPTSFSATKSGSDVKFTWSKVPQATGYQIFSSSSASGDYYILTEIDDVNTTSKTVYYPASSGTKTYFKIKAYWRTTYGGSPVDSDFSSYKVVYF